MRRKEAKEQVKAVGVAVCDAASLATMLLGNRFSSPPTKASPRVPHA